MNVEIFKNVGEDVKSVFYNKIQNIYASEDIFNNLIISKLVMIHGKYGFRSRNRTRKQMCNKECFD